MNTIQFIGLNPTDLINQIKKSLLEDLKEVIKENEPKRYLSADEVCSHFGITKPTLHDFRKKQMFKSYKLGGRVYYRLDEIENSMIVNN